MTPPRCESGTCLQVEVTGASTELWETMQPDIRVVTTTASWQSWLDQAADERQAAIVACLRNINDDDACPYFSVGSAKYFADLIELGELGVADDVVAGDE